MSDHLHSTAAWWQAINRGLFLLCMVGKVWHLQIHHAATPFDFMLTWISQYCVSGCTYALKCVPWYMQWQCQGRHEGPNLPPPKKKKKKIIIIIIIIKKIKKISPPPPILHDGMCTLEESTMIIFYYYSKSWHRQSNGSDPPPPPHPPPLRVTGKICSVQGSCLWPVTSNFYRLWRLKLPPISSGEKNGNTHTHTNKNKK